MATTKSRLYRLTAQILAFSLAVDPFALAQIHAAAAWEGVAADLRTAALAEGIPPTAARPAAAAAAATSAPAERREARRAGATSFARPAPEAAGSGEGAVTCAENLTQHRAPLASLVKTLLWPPNHSLV